MKVLTDRELMTEWIRFFGVGTGLRVLGWCAATAALMPLGDPEVDRRALLRYGWGSVSTRYRNVGRLEEFSAHMVEQGMRLPEDSETEAFRFVGIVA